MAEGVKPPRRSVVIVARLLAALISLASAESVLWFAGYPAWWALDPDWGLLGASAKCDPGLGWSARQGSWQWQGANNAAQYQLTNWGEGERATAPEKPGNPSLPKVQFFGDSFIQGYGLTDTETLPWIVQKRHPELQVSNFGIGLYGTYQSYLAMQRSVQGPAHVYYLFNWFHEGRNAGDPAFLRIMKTPAPGCFYPYADSADGEIVPGRSRGEVVWWLSRRLRTVAMAQDYKQIIESYWRVRNKRQTTEILLAKMNDLVRKQGGRFTVILFDLEGEDRAWYKSMLEARGIEILNCDRPELKDPALRLPDGHPNGKMNELLAAWIDSFAAAPAVVSRSYSAEAGSRRP